MCCGQTSDLVFLLILQVMKSDVRCTVNEYAVLHFEPI